MGRNLRAATARERVNFTRSLTVAARTAGESSLHGMVMTLDFPRGGAPAALTSHTSTPVAALPQIRVFPSLEKARAVKALSGAVNRPVSRAVVASHRRMVWSPPAEARVLP